MLRFSGDSLHLNVETSSLGLVRVEIQDADGKPLPGFALDDCDRIHTTNTTDAVVNWRRGKSSISSLAGKSVRLRFELMYGAKLYAFGTQAASPDPPSDPPPGQEQPN